jgi:hypothetical protein
MEHMQDDRELRNAILMLLRICKMFQVQALSLDTALSTVMDLPGNKRAKLTHALIQEEVQKAEAYAKQAVDDVASRVEGALTGNDPFLRYLRIYALKVRRSGF